MYKNYQKEAADARMAKKIAGNRYDAFTRQINSLRRIQEGIQSSIREAEEQAEIKKNLAEYLATNDMSENERITVGWSGMAPGFNPGN